jgi:hypothetical protein
MSDIKFHTGSNLGSWTYLWIQTNRYNHRETFDAGYLKQTLQKFVSFLMKSGITAGPPVQSPPPPVMLISDGDNAGNDKKIKVLFRAMCDSKLKPKFVLVILPYNDVAIYNSIKTVADTKAGIHTVCVVGSKFGKEQRQEQYFGNVALKINGKAGGINQTLDAPKLGVISEGRTMVVGIDVTHPSPGSAEGAPSVAGIVASVDKFLGQWPSDFSIQESRKEMVSALQTMFVPGSISG